MARRIEPKALLDWSEIADRGWKTLLVGNGMSINVSSKFDYGSLYEEAAERGKLDESDCKIFEAFETQNFELVLAKLRDAITLAEVMDRPPEPYRQRFLSIQPAVSKTIPCVHPHPREVSEARRASLQAAFGSHSEIFTTNYDLLAYWTMSHDNGFKIFGDCFLGPNGRCSFDPERFEAMDLTPVYYLHGALHLVVSGSGVTRKLTRSELEAGEVHLIDRFDKPVPDDPEARPLLVTEGASSDKLVEIEENDYLAYAYGKLKANADSLVIFGHSLGDQDQHLIDAINEHPGRRLAISIHRDPSGERKVHSQRYRILDKLGRQERDVDFFDAATHPLGQPEYRAEKRKGPARRRRRRVFRRG